jgi:hypothetical protein
MSSAGQVLLAANPLNLELIGASLALFGLILLGALAIVWAERRWKRSAEPPPPETPDSYRALYDQGVVSKEEYDRIRAHLDEKVRAALPSASVGSDGAAATPPPVKNEQDGATSG